MPPHEETDAASEPNSGTSAPPNTSNTANWGALRPAESLNDHMSSLPDMSHAHKIRKNTHTSYRSNFIHPFSSYSLRNKQYLTENKIDTALWLTRVFTIINSLLFLLPLFSPQFNYSCYKRALISSAATSALRLHQRLPRFQLSREFLGQLFLEDSCHYLIYCVMFINSYPVTMILIPVALFAILHTISFTKKLLDILGSGGIISLSIIRTARKSIDKIEIYQQGILRFIACTEIMLMPAVILMTFSGQAGIVIPFVYYRFLGLRYSSRRNPYCRQLFSEFRRGFEGMASHPRCPAFLHSFIFRATAFIASLAPAVTTTAS